MSYSDSCFQCDDFLSENSLIEYNKSIPNNNESDDHFELQKNWKNNAKFHFLTNWSFNSNEGPGTDRKK